MEGALDGTPSGKLAGGVYIGGFSAGSIASSTISGNSATVGGASMLVAVATAESTSPTALSAVIAFNVAVVFTPGH